MDDLAEQELVSAVDTPMGAVDTPMGAVDTPMGASFEHPPEPIANEASREEAVIEEDVGFFNFMLRRLNDAWKTNLDVEDTCKLAGTMMRLLEQRRRMMLLPTEANKEKGGKHGKGYFGAFSD